MQRLGAGQADIVQEVRLVEHGQQVAPLPVSLECAHQRARGTADRGDGDHDRPPRASASGRRVGAKPSRLEAIVGQPLFDKRGRRTVLNAQGQTLLQHARRMLVVQEEALAAFRHPDVRGEVRLGACDDYVLSFVPPILSRYASLHSQVHVRLDAQSSRRLVRATAQGELDIALVNIVDETVGHEKLVSEPLVWVTGARHLAHEKDPLPLALESDCVWGRWAQQALEGAGRPYRNAYSTFNVSGIVAVVDAGLAVSVMSRSSAPAGLRILGEADGFPALTTTSIGIVLRASPLSPAALAMVQLLREGIGPQALVA